MGAGECIRCSKSLVVQVIDDFTGKPVEGNKVIVSIAGHKYPVVKPDGYRVFVNLRETFFTLVCQSNIYNQWTGQINLSERDRDDILVIRMNPNGSYPLTDNVTVIAGQTQPWRHFWFWYQDSKELRLMRDYDSQGQTNRNAIDIYYPEGQEMAGRYFFISEAGEEEKEFFKITGRVDDQYRLDRELSRDYRKIGTVIVPVYEITADAKGEFFLPLARNSYGTPEKEIRMFCQAEGEQGEKVFTLLAGRITSITL